jgi:hypothetical protein
VTWQHHSTNKHCRLAQKAILFTTKL